MKRTSVTKIYEQSIVSYNIAEQNRELLEQAIALYYDLKPSDINRLDKVIDRAIATEADFEEIEAEINLLIDKKELEQP